MEKEKEKEVSISYGDGNLVDVYRYGHNKYSAFFHDDNHCVYGDYMDVARAVAKYGEKGSGAAGQTDSIPVEDEENHAMCSCGNYMNLWTTGGDYDVFIMLHEAEPQENFDKIIEHEVDETCRKVMRNTKLSTEEKKSLVETIFAAYTDFGVEVMIVEKNR